MADDADDDGLSPYEAERRRNILRNEEAMRRLGLDVSALTSRAIGRFAPQPRPRKAKKGRRPAQEPSRRSERLGGIDAPSLPPASDAAAPGTSSNSRWPAASKRKRAREDDDDDADDQEVVRAPPASPRSCRNLRAKPAAEMRASYLGREIPPVGGTQAKLAVMDAVSAEGRPTFSRMSGIQEFRTAVCLFVNVYGDGYKNAFLGGGREVTWFAQPRQWDGTPVVQRLVESDSSRAEDDDDDGDATDVYLFCREAGKPFVYCGSLSYLGHDPTRIPVRFAWRLDDFDELSRHSEPFLGLVAACDALVPGGASSSSSGGAATQRNE